TFEEPSCLKQRPWSTLRWSSTRLTSPATRERRKLLNRSWYALDFELRPNSDISKRWLIFGYAALPSCSGGSDLCPLVLVARSAIRARRQAATSDGQERECAGGSALQSRRY